jgi:hypothetical protein
MKCPHLIKWITFACKAEEKLYFPSPFQLQEYCKQKEHRKCPFNLKVYYDECIEGLTFRTLQGETSWNSAQDSRKISLREV